MEKIDFVFPLYVVWYQNRNEVKNTFCCFVLQVEMEGRMMFYSCNYYFVRTFFGLKLYINTQG